MKDASSASILTAEADQMMTDANRMEKLTTAMADICKASEETGKFIRNIDEIGDGGGGPGWQRTWKSRAPAQGSATTWARMVSLVRGVETERGRTVRSRRQLLA